jgi:hypothetical protein
MRNCLPLRGSLLRWTRSGSPGGDGKALLLGAKSLSESVHGRWRVDALRQERLRAGSANGRAEGAWFAQRSVLTMADRSPGPLRGAVTTSIGLLFLIHASVSPGSLEALHRMNKEIEVRHVTAGRSCPDSDPARVRGQNHPARALPLHGVAYADGTDRDDPRGRPHRARKARNRHRR